MATTQTMRTIVLDAGADLSAAQFELVKLNTAQQVILVAATTDIPIGVLQNKPDASGKRALIALLDGAILKLKAGAAITAGALVGLDGTFGRGGAPGDAGEVDVGVALDAADDGDVFSFVSGIIRAHA